MENNPPGATAVRRAALSDLPRLLAMEQASPMAAHWAELEYRKALAEDSSDTDPVQCIVLVVESDGQVSGFLAARSAHPAEWEIENIVVDAAVRRLGFGGALLGAFLERTRSRRSQSEALAFHLEVRESNLAARRLYEKFGFQLDRRRRAYYRQPDEDAVLYVL